MWTEYPLVCYCKISYLLSNQYKAYHITSKETARFCQPFKLIHVAELKTLLLFSQEN